MKYYLNGVGLFVYLCFIFGFAVPTTVSAKGYTVSHGRIRPCILRSGCCMVLAPESVYQTWRVDAVKILKASTWEKLQALARSKISLLLLAYKRLLMSTLTKT